MLGLDPRLADVGLAGEMSSHQTSRPATMAVAARALEDDDVLDRPSSR